MLIMDDIKDQIEKTIIYLRSQMAAHKGFVELQEFSGNKAIIYCGGKCTACDIRCIEEELMDKFPGINFIFR